MDFEVDKVTSPERPVERTELHEILEAQLEEVTPTWLTRELIKLDGETLQAIENNILDKRNTTFGVFADIDGGEAQGQLLERLKQLKGYQSMNPTEYRNLMNEIDLLLKGDVIPEKEAA